MMIHVSQTETSQRYKDMYRQTKYETGNICVDIYKVTLIEKNSCCRR